MLFQPYFLQSAPPQVFLWRALFFTLCLLALMPIHSKADTSHISTSTKHLVFEHFSIDVLEGWNVHSDETVITLSHPKRLCALSVMAVLHQDVPFRELVIAFYQNLKGKNLRSVDPGTTFDLDNDTDMPSVARLSENGPVFSAVTVMGQCEPFTDMISSLVILDENKKPYANALRAYPLLGEAGKKEWEESKKLAAERTKKAREEQAAQKAAAEKAAQKAAKEKAEQEKTETKNTPNSKPASTQGQKATP